MITEAPHPSGKRYAVVCLHVAHQKGEDGVVNAARAWLENLLLPVLAISKAGQTKSATSQTSDSESASQNDQPVPNVACREQYRCVITNWFDCARAKQLAKENRVGEIPTGPKQGMEVAHIIPFGFNQFDDEKMNAETTGAACTWQMLRSWTRIDFTTLVGPNINSPTNTIYMTMFERHNFAQFDFYFDKDAYPDIPNKYKARMSHRFQSFSNGSQEADVVFPTSSVEPPNPDFLKVHASFAKVLHICGAVLYMDGVEWDAEREPTLCWNGETDFGSYLRFRLAASIFF